MSMHTVHRFTAHRTTAVPCTVPRAAILPHTAPPRTHASLGITTTELEIHQPSSSGALGSGASAAAVECASALLDDPASSSVGEDGTAPRTFVSPLDDSEAFGPDEDAYFRDLEASLEDAPNDGGDTGSHLLLANAKHAEVVDSHGLKLSKA